MTAPGVDRPVARSAAERLVAVLEAVATARDGVGVRSLARDTGIDRSAVSRILRDLTALGLAAPGPGSGRYGIGPRLFALAGTVVGRDDLRAAAAPILESLAERFDETTYLAVRERDGVVYRDVVESTQPIRYVAELGVPSPLHVGAVGRAVLAALADDEFEPWLAGAVLTAETGETITSADDLRVARRKDRARGYAVSRGERVAGGAAVAAAFRDGSGRIRGALAVTCPADRLPKSRSREIGPVLVAAAAQLSWRLGLAMDGGDGTAGNPTEPPTPEAAAS